MNWSKLEIYLLIGGFVIAIAGNQLAVPILTSVGLGIVALAIVLVGLQAVITRKMEWAIKWYSHETYQGFAAIALGLIVVIFGIGVGAMVAAQALHREESFFALIFSRPGIVLLLIGAILFLRGLAGVIGAAEWNKTATSRLLNGVIERLVMLVSLLFGALLLILGAVEILAPSVFDWLVIFVWQTFLNLLGIH